MKILYAVQATGNGHISRAMEIIPHLEKFGKVDIFLSGSNATLNYPLPIKYTSKGLSIFYSKCGGLDFKRTWRDNSLYRAKREALDLPVEDYDLILNDFEFITARACSIKNIPSVQFGHQASFMSEKTPRPEKRNLFGEMILKKYAPASHYIGLHFQSYDSFIFPPVIKESIVKAEPRDDGHVCVYLPAYDSSCIEEHLQSLSHIHFHWFLPGIEKIVRQANISYYPVDNRIFTESLINCHGIITGGGFETPAEALYLNKKLLSIPIRAQYEQQCNAAALGNMGITTLADADTPDFAQQIEQWLAEPKPIVYQAANNIPLTLEWIADNFAGEAVSASNEISFDALSPQWNM